MTHHVIKTLDDGTRVYSNYTKYKPLSDEERKYQRRKPDVEGAVMYNKEWYLPLELAEERVMPETRPDTVAYDHMGKGRKCTCLVCQRPEAVYWQTKWLKDRGIWTHKRKKYTRKIKPVQASPSPEAPGRTSSHPPNAGTDVECSSDLEP